MSAFETAWLLLALLCGFFCVCGLTLVFWFFLFEMLDWLDKRPWRWRK